VAVAAVIDRQRKLLKNKKVYTMQTVLTKIALAASLAVALSACGTVGQDFTAPANVAGIDTFRHGAAAADAAQLPREWWSIYGDATLDRLEQSALQDNPSVKAAGQRLLQALAQSGTARANQGPSVNVSTGISNSRTSANTSQGLALGNRSISGNNFSVGGSLSYEVDLLGRVKRMVEAADSQALAAQADRDGVLLMLSAQVASNYWQLRGLDAEMAILNGALDTRRESAQLVEARFNAGLTNELDLARAKVELSNAQADLHEVKRQRNQLENSLATLTGKPPSALQLPPVAAEPSSLPLPPSIPVGLPASLLAQRPDLVSSVANLRAANAQVGVAEGAFYPSLQLTGNFGYASEKLRDLAQGGSRQFSFGPLALSLPIFDGGRNQANLDLSKARYAEAVANHETKLLTALREVEDALSDVEQRQLQGDAQALSQAAAARAYLVARTRYERGISTYLDVTDAQRSSLAADRAAAQIKTQRLLATVAVARSLGAGWKPDGELAKLAKAN
jgi:outer membrane protein, multidrug efflux system